MKKLSLQHLETKNIEWRSTGKGKNK